MRARSWMILTAWLALSGAPAMGDSLPFDPAQFANPANLVPASSVKSFIQAVGILADHRPYQPADALGTHAGVDFGIELTLVKMPPDFLATLALAGVNAGANITSLPVPKIHLHKGLGDFVDIGLSAIAFNGMSIYGADLKATFYQPEEGVSWAVRMNYANAHLGFVSTQTYTPQLLISKRLDFADPYMGIGYEYAYGTVNFPLPAPIPYNLVASAQSGGAMAFMGLALRVPDAGLKLTLEGAYSTVGEDTLGTKFGFEF